MAFVKTDISKLSFNPFNKIGKEWMLITGGNKDNFNTMTASWGQLGVLWNKNVLTCYIRTNRYTIGYVEEGEFFTASFFDEKYRSALSYCGTHSGKDFDKVKEAGLTPAEFEGAMGFEEANMVLVCRKLYTYDMQESGFVTDEGLVQQYYSKDPYHKAFIAEIIGVYVKE